MVSGLCWLQSLLPAQSHIVKDGAVSHARVKLGADVFRLLFHRLAAAIWPIAPDFHGLASAVFDGSTGTMPDTCPNRDRVRRPSSRSGYAAFPQMRLMALMALSVRVIFDIAYASYAGKGTGERFLVMQTLKRLICRRICLHSFVAGRHRESCRCLEDEVCSVVCPAQTRRWRRRKVHRHQNDCA